jgi:hypothetical protein
MFRKDALSIEERRVPGIVRNLPDAVVLLDPSPDPGGDHVPSTQHPVAIPIGNNELAKKNLRRDFLKYQKLVCGRSSAALGN